MLYLYHVTDRKNLPKIKSEGLTPVIGESSRLAIEKTPRIYLCERKDAPYWTVLTGGDCLLKIRTSCDNRPYSWAENLQYREYDNAKEYMTDQPIPPEHIVSVTEVSDKERRNIMPTLLVNRICSLSYLTTECISLDRRLRESGSLLLAQKQTAKELANYIECELKIAERLNWTTGMPRAEMAKAIRHHSNEDCAFTFSDYYYDKSNADTIPDAGKRCYQHLPNIPIPELQPAATHLFRFIQKNIPYSVRNLTHVGGFS